MVSVCFYFQVHQPKRLRHYTYFDIGQNHNYEDDQLNQEILSKVAQRCYLPANALMLNLIKKFSGTFKISFSISGVTIEQFKRFSPETLDSFKQLADTGCVEFLNETYYHSLSILFSEQEFIEQVKQHHELIQNEFGQNATTFRNTELIYNNYLAKLVESLGYQAILAAGADKILDWRSSNYLYHAHGTRHLKLLLKNYPLSDDIAFRFSTGEWKQHPLTAEKFAYWIHETTKEHDLINLFMDYETFGEHQCEAESIFSFFEALPGEILANPEFNFCTPKEAAAKLDAIDHLNAPNYYSWADIERDLSVWRGNDLQEDALLNIYGLETKVKDLGDPDLLKAWRSLLTSDHFHYMCTKWFSDSDIHKCFSPYDNPYLAYINFQNVAQDLRLTVEKKLKARAC
jgi:alpha-amylase